MDTTVVVNDGDILVLGGLIEDTRMEGENRVPLLSKIPILGHLFRDRNSSNNSQTLMIFIRPTILRTPEDSYEFSKEKYAQLRLKQLLHGQAVDSLLSDEEIEGKAVLPDVEAMEQEKRRITEMKEGDEAVKNSVVPVKKKRRVVRRVIRRRPAEAL